MSAESEHSNNICKLFLFSGGKDYSEVNGETNNDYSDSGIPYGEDYQRYLFIFLLVTFTTL
jgi:hypothetical protein